MSYPYGKDFISLKFPPSYSNFPMYYRNDKLLSVRIILIYRHIYDTTRDLYSIIGRLSFVSITQLSFTKITIVNKTNIFSNPL